MSAAPIKVLVIDDEPPIRKLLRMGLGSQGYEILEASDGKIAETVWASLLFAHDRPEALEPLEVDVRCLPLPAQVGLLVIDQIEEEP